MRYTEIAKAKPFEGAPKINIASVYGASPKKPIMIRIPVTGARPVTYGALGLPKGLTIEGNVISGKVKAEGSYEITLTAENALGKAEKKLTLEIKKDTVCLTPLLGWTSWNAFGFQVTQENIESSADKIIELGLAEYGYNYVNTDSGWQGKYGGKYDAIMPNEKFPNMKEMVEKIHSKGLKAGIYSTPMLVAFGCSMQHDPLPPGCTQGEPDDMFGWERSGIGKIRKEKNNARQWADFGFDYLKYDWRPCDPYNAEMMRRELVKTGRDFGFCVTVRARPEYRWYWTKYCNSYRNNPDTICNWKRHMVIYNSYFEYVDYVNKGHYCDLDMLDSGKCHFFTHMHYPEREDYGLTEDEQIVAYSMRAFLNSPIQISSDLSEASEFEMDMYCNDEIIAINQDAAFDSAKPIIKIDEGAKKIHVFKKVLEDGRVAYALFNLGENTETVEVELEEKSEIRDAWAKRDLEASDKISLEMPSHTARIFTTKKGA